MLRMDTYGTKHYCKGRLGVQDFLPMRPAAWSTPLNTSPEPRAGS